MFSSREDEYSSELGATVSFTKPVDDYVYIENKAQATIPKSAEKPLDTLKTQASLSEKFPSLEFTSDFLLNPKPAENHLEAQYSDYVNVESMMTDSYKGIHPSIDRSDLESLLLEIRSDLKSLISRK
jgi:hypothetical protein